MSYIFTGQPTVLQSDISLIFYIGYSSHFYARHFSMSAHPFKMWVFIVSLLQMDALISHLALFVITAESLMLTAAQLMNVVSNLN